MKEFSKEIRLLIAEDNPGDFILIEEYLKAEIAHCLIYHVTTFAQAKEYLTGDFKLDAILLDLSLPDASGENLINEVLQLSGLTPIIVLTGYADKDFSIYTLSLGISDYLLKDELSASLLCKSIAYSIKRKRISLKLKESEIKYRNLFHLSPLPMWVYDIKTYGFLNVNEAAIRNYGYSREEFLAMTIKDIRPAEDIKLFEEKIICNKITNAIYCDSFRHTKKNGELIYVDIQSNEIDFEKKKARLILATDIGDRLKYMETIEEQNTKLQEIAFIQSHIVRAPLARIMGLIDLLNNYSNNTKNATEYLNLILTSAKELDEIIKTIVEKAAEVENQIKG